MSPDLATTDPDTGVRLYVYPMHWSVDNMTFALYSEEQKPFFLGDCKHSAIDETDAGGATLVRFILERAWIPPGIPEPPTLIYGNCEHIDQLGKLVLQWCAERPARIIQPRYEFEDGREGYRRMTEPRKHSVKDVMHALFGLAGILRKGFSKNR